MHLYVNSDDAMSNKLKASNKLTTRRCLQQQVHVNRIKHKFWTAQEKHVQNLPVLQMWQTIATNASPGNARSMCMLPELRATCSADDTRAACVVCLPAPSRTYWLRDVTHTQENGGRLCHGETVIADATFQLAGSPLTGQARLSCG